MPHCWKSHVATHLSSSAAAAVTLILATNNLRPIPFSDKLSESDAVLSSISCLTDIFLQSAHLRLHHALVNLFHEKMSYAFPKMVQDCVFAQSSEFQFGVRNPGSAGSKFGERTRPNLGWQNRSSEKGPGRTLVQSSERDRFLSPNSEVLAGSEFGEWTGLNPGSAGSEFGERQVPFSGPKLRTRVWPGSFSI